MGATIEEAKSGRASCRTCKKTIAKGELRLGVEVTTQFSDQPSMQWHHLPCAAGKLAGELKDALATFDGDVPDREALDAAIEASIKKGNAKPAGFPYVDRAPTGRAKCMQCEAAIGKDTFRVAVEREIDTGAMVTRGAGYMHPKCVAANLENVGGSVEELIEGVQKNSRITAEDLEGVIAEFLPDA
ncbi:MAG: PARP-type zinc finger-containing protein [Proteobacteria bacterium]|nr:PARP-type zinc finger-containing protein [Pseudomonadota bacterium]